MLTAKEKNSLHKKILTAEKATNAEIHIAFYKSLKHASVLLDAQQYFHHLELHQNKNKNNVLIYIVQDAHRFAILGDKGIHEKVGDAYWKKLCDELSEKFKKNQIYTGLVQCINQLKKDLEKYYPVAKA